jgi:acetyl-CoA C-acetyltransferase
VLRTVALPELGAHAVGAALRRAGVAPGQVDEVAIGVNFPGSERSVARQVQLQASIPDDRVAYTVDRACCSSLAAINLASRGVRSGDVQTAIAGGVENLSRVPYFLETARFGQRLGDVVLTDQLVVSCPHSGVPRAVQAASEAASLGIFREEQDEWAWRSQQRYATALSAGFFEDEIAPVATTDGSGRDVALDHDEVPRPSTSIAALRALPTVYGSSSVTAGNAPDLSSGAAVVVLEGASSGAHATLATIVGAAAAAGDPQHIASMPAVAGQLALKHAGLTLDDVDVLEINEAFAAVPLVTTLVLASGDLDAAVRLRDRTNVNGGAIAIGHPTGATGARLVMTAVAELRRRGGGTALVTICGGIGEAEAVVLTVDAGAGG